MTDHLYWADGHTLLKLGPETGHAVLPIAFCADADTANRLLAAFKTEGFPGTGVAAIAAERQRQIGSEGFDPKHDDAHTIGELAMAAAAYVENAGDKADVPALWPWADHWWKPTDRRGDLVKAGALIAAEIDRLDRRDARRQQTCAEQEYRADD